LLAARRCAAAADEGSGNVLSDEMVLSPTRARSFVSVLVITVAVTAGCMLLAYSLLMSHLARRAAASNARLRGLVCTPEDRLQLLEYIDSHYVGSPDELPAEPTDLFLGQAILGGAYTEKYAPTAQRCRHQLGPAGVSMRKPEGSCLRDYLAHMHTHVSIERFRTNHLGKMIARDFGLEHAKTLCKLLAPGTQPRVLEWSSGGSTLLFTKYAGSWDVIEHDSEWYAKVKHDALGLEHHDSVRVHMASKDPKWTSYVQKPLTFATQPAQFDVVRTQYHLSITKSWPTIIGASHLLISVGHCRRKS
jgi:hypothetical protein